MNNKKGISPLIATVLIVGFTIVLAVLVITWISGTVKTTTDNADQQTTAGELCLDVMGKVKTSVTGTYVLHVSNEGSKGLSNVRASWLNSAGVSGQITETGAMNAYDTTTSVPTATSGYEKVRVMIFVTPTGGQEAKCGETEITIPTSGVLTLITYYRDADTDSYGNPAVTTQAATQPTGYVLDNTDCNDTRNTVNPGVSEPIADDCDGMTANAYCCNGIDDDCSGGTNSGDSCPVCQTEFELRGTAYRNGCLCFVPPVCSPAINKYCCDNGDGTGTCQTGVCS